MSLSRFVQTIQRDDLPSSLQLMADIVGIDAVRLLLQELSAYEIYIPQPRRMRGAVRRYIRENYTIDKDGVSNADKIAAEVGLRRRYVESLAKSMSLK